MPQGAAMYRGDAQHGQPHGEGRLTYVSRPGSALSYKGEFYRGFRHGHGDLILGPATHYTGEFSYDRRHGSGRHTFPNATLQGKYEAGVLEGHGKCT